jgi:predicted dehydrogenase
MSNKQVHRRDFLKTTAAAGAALTLTAASARRVYGANERIGVAFIGTGGRCQAHLNVINKLHKEKNTVAPVAVCDLWDGHYEENEVERNGKKVKQIYSQGLYPSAKKVGLKEDDKEHVTKDYRKILDLKEVDVVCVATPDHWHAKISIDAARAGKDVYCEKPMTKTMREAQIVVDVMQKEKRVMSVGVQSMADPRWREANELIRQGRIGHVAQAQTSYYRNSEMGQWRYYKLFKDMNPKTIDWDTFLGYDVQIEPGEPPLGPKMPFDRAVFGQWRCYWPFGGGMFTDLFVHQTTHMIAAMGVRYPRRVVGAGGLYLEYDGRDVPDVSTVVADYNEGCQLMITATMIASYPIEEVIRGHLATIKFMKDGFTIINDPPKGRPGIPARLEETVKGDYTDVHPPKTSKENPDADTQALWENFLNCVRDRNRDTLSPPELGAAAFTTVSMGVESYRRGVALFWDAKERRPVQANPSWAQHWERVSKEHGKPHQVIGWQGGDKGSTLTPPDYQKLAGPWVNGKDPAEGTAGG